MKRLVRLNLQNYPNTETAAILAKHLELALAAFAGAAASEDLQHAREALWNLAQRDPYLQIKLERISNLMTAPR